MVHTSRVKPNLLARARDHLQPEHVIGSLAVSQSARSAGVVSDHAADRAAVIGRRIRPETQTVRGCCDLQARLHNPRFDARRTRLRIDFNDLVQIPRGVQDQSGADRIARARCSGAPHGHRYSDCPGRIQHCCHLFDGSRACDSLRYDTVEGRVGGVEPTSERGRVEDIFDAASPELERKFIDFRGQRDGLGHDRV